MHFVRCKAVALKVGYRKRTEKFQTVHKSLKTAGVIYHSLLSMLRHLRDGGEPPSFVSYIASPMDNLVMEAWEEQSLIGWDQILKGRIGTKWGKAQGLFYRNNSTTRKEKHLTAEVWVSKTIASLLRFTLGLWKDRCDTLHGATLVERQRMKRDKIMDRLKLCYIQRDTIPECYRYIFRDAYETIGKKSTQYLVKWLCCCKNKGGMWNADHNEG